MPGNFHSVPESVIASWPTPNYVDPIERTWLPALVYVLVSLQTVLIAGRFYLRARRMAGDFGYDDLFIFIGYVVSIGFATTAVLGTERYYLSRHTWDVPISAYVGVAKNGWIAQILFIISTCATKASILLFYRRMAKDTYSALWRYAIWLALGFTFAYFVAVLVAYCFICQPLDAYWLSYNFSYDKPFTCLNGDALSPLVGSLSILSDLYATILPWSMLYFYNLDVPRKQKVALNIIFSLSLIVAGCGVGRLYYLWKINNSYDTSWTGFDLFVWALLECHLAIIFACAPSLRAFVRRYLQDPISRTLRSGTYSRNQSQTKDSSVQNSSTLRSSFPTTASKTDALGTASERGLVKSDQETVVTSAETWSRRTSDTMMPIASADDYETYNMKQLQRYRSTNEAGQSQSRPVLNSNARSYLTSTRQYGQSPPPQTEQYVMQDRLESGRMQDTERYGQYDTRTPNANIRTYHPGEHFRSRDPPVARHARDQSNASERMHSSSEVDMYSAV